MASSLIHRGPDDAGFWLDNEICIALGHRRLSILDLSAEGHQPMISACGRYVIAFNGEIYNHVAIRQQLQQEPEIAWRGHSDTEVMLAAISHWGLNKAIHRFVGMFAFALWDRSERTLSLARDRLGEKPLYYGWSKNCFLFGSELKALRAHPQWAGEVDRNSLALFLRHSYVPSPYTIYQNIFKLPPGCILTISNKEDKAALPMQYWSLQDVAHNGVRNPFTGGDVEAIDQLEKLLSDAIALQMVADVPLGAFLSGGIDSSTIVSLMQLQSTRPVKTFTIGFTEAAHNEAQYAAEIARYLGTEHTELYVSPRDALDVIPKLPTIYDEPFSDSSQIPTYLVSKLTRTQVTVSLSGDGGDELFGGYPRYVDEKAVWNNIQWIPRPLRKGGAMALTMFSPSTWDRFLSAAKSFVPQDISARVSGHRLHRLAEVLPSRHPEELHLGMVSHWQQPEALALMAKEPSTALTDKSRWVELPDLISRMMFLDSITYLPDDLLVKVDRAAMAVSLESRIPFLDHRLVEFAWSLSSSMKIRDGKSKWILRKVLERHVPNTLTDRPKMGFSIPMDDWLRGPLRDWAESLLDEERLANEGFLNPIPVRDLWHQHIAGEHNRAPYLWDVLMFQAWLRAQ